MAIDAELTQLFEEFVDSFADSMYRVAYRLTGNATLAQLSNWR